MSRFLVVPQWQGSPSPRSMQLALGAEAIAADLPRSSCTRVDVPLEAGDGLGTAVHRLSSLIRTRDAMATALDGESDHVIIVGGDCSVALGGISHALTQGGSLALVWCDAHGDLHTPESSPSHAFGGMALRAALGEGIAPLRLDPAIDASRTVLVGARELDPFEEVFFLDAPVRRVAPEALADPDTLATAVAATGAESAYIHIDLDVFDPAAFTGVSMSVPFGVLPAALIANLRALRQRMPIVGAAICGFAPVSEEAALEDLPTILRLIGALT